MTKQINLDMDGTFVDLYGVENWLPYLQNADPTPYEIAKPLVNLNSMAKAIHKLQNSGWKITIISWLAKNSDATYDEKVTAAKKGWLKKHLKSVQFDEINIVPYGTPKSACGTGILFDDEEKNRNDWIGIAYNADNLLKDLRSLA